MASEAGPTPEAELVQERIADARRVFAQRPNGESEYRAFREFLITHGYAQHVDAIRALLPSKIPLADLFQEIVSDATLTVDGTAYFYPCPRCRWPLRRRENTLSCACAGCRAAGARFRVEAERLVPLGPASVPLPMPAATRVQLRRGAWRYTLLPGLAEMDLADRLRQLPAVRVELWPHLDLYDLRVRHGEAVWKFDVKDWSDPSALANRLHRRPPDPDVTIVVPDRQRRHLDVLSARCGDLGLSFKTVSDVVADVRAKAAAGSAS